MTTAKPNKQIIIDFIISQLEKGMDRGPILVKVGQKWGTSKTTFDRLLKIAREQHQEKQSLLKGELHKVEVEAAVKARKKAIMTVEERKLYLTKLIKGEIKIPYTEVKWNAKKEKFEKIRMVELAGHTARIAGIAELNKMEGEHQVLKVSTNTTINQPADTKGSGPATSAEVEVTLEIF